MVAGAGGAEQSGRGLFVVLDGVDGCGKTTQARALARRLEAETGRSVVHLREPGSTRLGESLRALLLSREYDHSPEVEALLFAAARRATLDDLVAPALRAGSHVVCERFHPSTYAYQGCAGDLEPADVLALLSRWAGEPRPDLVLVLDVEPREAGGRRGEPTDRIEDKGLGFQELVAEGYRRYVVEDERARLLSGGGPIEEVGAAVWREVLRAL